MNWTRFQTYGDAPTKAFEVLCNQLFENWCRQEYETILSSFNVVNGAGGDGGVESYAVLKTGDIVGLQAKWFPSTIEVSQIAQVKNSIRTAMKIRPQIVRYIVCIPRDLASVTGRTKGENAESNRWEAMTAAMIEEFPKLTIELWNETRILTELQKSSSAGIYKFWFERAEVSDESIKQAFFRSKSGWLSNLYVPDLNTFGEIDKYTSKYLGTKLQRVKLKRTFSHVNSLCEIFLESLGELLSICKKHDSELEPMLMEVGEQILKMNDETKRALLWFDNESYDIALDKSAFWIDLRDIIGRLKSSCAAHAYHFYFSEASKILKKLEQIDMGSMLSDFETGNSQESLVFLGEPGTGKTHGFAAEVERLLDEGYHIPILIRARDVPSYYGWKDIVIASLGLSNIWSDDEIWQALSALANRKKIHALDTIEQVSIFPKVIIMVDGVDESLPHQKWVERIREAGAIVQAYPQIRFCFSSRPSVFHGNTDVSAKYIRIGNSGDVPVSMLFESYINTYEIKTENANWLKYAITTPLALKLFCDINRGKTIEYCNRADITINKLIQQKINLLESEFCSQVDTISECDAYVLQVILMLTSEFTTNMRVERNKLIGCITQQLPLDRNQTKTLLTFLENYGVICRISEYEEDYLTPVKNYYIPGIQGYFDYVSALLLLKEYKYPQRINFETCKYIEQNALYILSIISIQNHDYLISENPTIAFVADNWFQQELLFVGLRHTGLDDGTKYRDWLLSFMGKSAGHLTTVVNDLILPLSREPEHPLGVQLLDTFLKTFEKPAQRDILWSVPPFLRDSEGEKWESYTELDLENSEYSLSGEDVAEATPLVFAWALSLVDNAKRKIYRDVLMKWALLSPAEFYKLFLNFAPAIVPGV